jgi:hypothetical protein
MNRALLTGAALAAASLAAAPDEAHAICSVLAHHPCTPYFGSVLRRQPFTPYSCGVSGGPCSPQVPPGQSPALLMAGDYPVLRIEGRADLPVPADRGHPVDRLDEIGPLLSKCLELPPESSSQAGMEVTMRFAVKRNGELVADPLFTYTNGAPQNVKAAYHAAALDMFKRCTPLPVTDSFGRALAGHPVVVAIRDTRDLKSGARPNAAGPADAKP